MITSAPAPTGCDAGCKAGVLKGRGSGYLFQVIKRGILEVLVDVLLATIRGSRSAPEKVKVSQGRQGESSGQKARAVARQGGTVVRLVRVGELGSRGFLHRRRSIGSVLPGPLLSSHVRNTHYAELPTGPRQHAPVAPGGVTGGGWHREPRARGRRRHLPDGTAIGLRRPRSECLRGVGARHGASLLMGHAHHHIHLCRNISWHEVAPVGCPGLHLLTARNQGCSVPIYPRAARHEGPKPPS